MRRALLLGCIAATVLAGCGGGGDHGSSARTATVTSPPSSPATPASAVSLRQGVHSAIQANARLSRYVLWRNLVPSWARQSTRGPALRGLRSSASGRRARGLRICSVSQRVEVMSIALDPSYLLATARVRESGRIVPYRNGHRLGRSVALNEVARVELDRVANTDRFVVWEVKPGR
jgi:hypothetical protein